MQQGPSTERIPQQTRKVCRGCTFLNTKAGLRGHTVWQDHYLCTNPDAKEFPFSRTDSLFGRGRVIATFAEQMPDTPDWCPILKAKNEKPNG